MPRPQQRAPRNRRRLSPNTPRLTTILTATALDEIGGIVYMHLEAMAVSGATVYVPMPFCLDGIPAVRRRLDGLNPTAASIETSSGAVVLTYGGAAVTALEWFDLCGNDPAIRTADGGFAGPFCLSAT